MDIDDTAEEAAFRAEARAWLGANATPHGARADHDPDDLAAHVERARSWQRTLYDGGWAGLSWPEAFGGRALPPTYASIFAEELADFDETVGPLTVGLGMVAPTLMQHGSPEQHERIAPMLRGDEMWCQLFSEPGAGSDLATLATRAERDGDTWVVNGQKVWTSLAQFAEYGILLARTDPDVPKHQGLTYFIVDMSDLGIEVRPLTQITGAAHFNETFLTDVRIPHANVVGDVGDGWNVARTTLTSERSSIAGGNPGWSVEDLVADARERGLADDPLVRQELAAAHTRALVLKVMGYRMRSALSAGRLPGPEALAMKLGYARHWVATTETALHILGADAMTYAGHGTWQYSFLNQFAIRLGGGTDEVQQNIIGELGLGLPREPSADRGVPWKDLPR